jgi:hypothetical protein
MSFAWFIIIAHGMGGVSSEDAGNCVKLARPFLIGLVPDSDEKIRNYPFTKEKIRELVGVLLA